PEIHPDVAQTHQQQLAGLRSAPDCRTRRAFLHLSYSCASPFGPALLRDTRPERDISSAFGTGHYGAHHTRLSGFHSKSSACRCLDMPSQLVQGLVAVLDGAEADRLFALCFGRMQLPQRDHGLAVALLIERNRGAKTAWIVIHVRTVIN